MVVHCFDYAALTPTIWKNGGGMTTELASWPPNATMESFEWRISIAKVASSGPFSCFQHIDRTIMLLDGAGFQLKQPEGSIILNTPLRPFMFAGETATECSLIDGVSKDFNIMTRRNQWQSTVKTIHQATQIKTNTCGLLFVYKGKWSIHHAVAGPILCDAEQGLWWPQADHDMVLTPLTDEAQIIAVELLPRMA